MGFPSFGEKLGRFVALGCLCLLVGSCAGESRGLAAYRKGDYPAAAREFAREEGPDADFAMGIMYYKGQGVRRDLGRASGFFLRAAEAGHAGAQYNLGLMYANGNGVRRDPREAARWYFRAATNGNDKAQYNLGIMYARGDGVAADQRRSLYWIGKSARQGNPRALKCLRERRDRMRSADRSKVRDNGDT